MPKKSHYKKPKFCKKRQRSFDSDLEIEFYDAFLYYKLPPPETQVPPHKDYPWRFDFAWSNKMLAIEVQGYGQGHTSYLSMLKDYRKHNFSVSNGWTVLYFMSENLKPLLITNTILLIRKMLNVGSEEHNEFDNLHPAIKRRRIEVEKFNSRQYRRDI